MKTPDEVPGKDRTPKGINWRIQDFENLDDYAIAEQLSCTVSSVRYARYRRDALSKDKHCRSSLLCQRIGCTRHCTGRSLYGQYCLVCVKSAATVLKGCSHEDRMEWLRTSEYAPRPGHEKSDEELLPDVAIEIPKGKATCVRSGCARTVPTYRHTYCYPCLKRARRSLSNKMQRPATEDEVRMYLSTTPKKERVAS